MSISVTARLEALPAFAAAAVLFTGPLPAVAGEQVILDSNRGFLRVHTTYRTPSLIGTDGQLQPLKTRYHKRRNPDPKPMKVTCSGYPDEDWAAPDFDDLSWGRLRGGVLIKQQTHDLWHSTGTAWLKLVTVRGKFRITDPAKAGKLKLTVSYHGGVLVCLNGTELTRKHLPPGNLTFESTAEGYPRDAYVNAEGRQPNPWSDGEKHPEIFANRLRRMQAEVPSSALREGVNVLAVAVYRAPIDAALHAAEFTRFDRRRKPGPWPHCALMELKLLETGGAGGVVPNAGRPEGPQVWHDLQWHDISPSMYGDPCEGLQPLRLTGARNGAFTGRFVLSSDRRVAGLKVRAGPLEADGVAALPASAVQLRYSTFPERLGRRVAVEALMSKPPEAIEAKPRSPSRSGVGEAVAFQAVWATVRVPPEAGPGTYKGEVTVEAFGTKPLKVPLELKVHDWRMPDPADYASQNNIWQSVESVALRYKAPLWSEKHFEILGKVLALTTPLGNKFCEVHLITPGEDIGNTQSYVYWVDKSGMPVDPEKPAAWSPDREYAYDFTVFDRYLDLYEERVGKPGLVLIDVWAWGADKMKVKTPGGGRGRTVFRTEGDVRVKVSLLDPKTGSLGLLKQPLYGTPESKAFWKPVLDEVRKRLEERGWWDAVCLGTGSDDRPLPQTAAVFHEIWPRVPWFSTGHVRPTRYPLGNDTGYVNVRCSEWVWGCGTLWQPGKGTTYPRPCFGWYKSLAFPREGSGSARLKQGSPLHHWRLNGERSLQCGLAGIGRVAADCWRVPGRGLVCGEGGQYNFSASITQFFHAGPEGPVPTARSEMFRQGMQVREAIIYLQKALEEKLVDLDTLLRCKRLLEERATCMVRAGTGRTDMQEAAWRSREDRLFALCADVAREIDEIRAEH
jgi:hypothetical protein